MGNPALLFLETIKRRGGIFAESACLADRKDNQPPTVPAIQARARPMWRLFPGRSPVFDTSGGLTLRTAGAISREHATNAQGRNPWVHEKNIVKPGSALINLANAKGGRDNIAVVLIRAMDAPDKAGKLSRWLVG